MTEPLIKKLRCAVYTRKSHEEGLEQAFNSLDAQREAGIAYIASQKHEGWILIPELYDDGGYSGGNVERPALQKLLSDIHAGKVDVIVVYKVDRLSRSLHDFAQMMNVFDKQQVSFVSVTQQFNTTTSMGRLTLNILLSFAQFEREVTGERIRDKFAASKKKGIWMGGSPPLGYTIVDRLLVIVEKEAELVRKIYAGYLQSQSPLELAETLNAQGYTTKHWASRSNRLLGGKSLTPSYLNFIIRNAVYMGKTAHKGNCYDGQHAAIIDEETWHKVNDAIKRQERNVQKRWNAFFLLKKKLKTQDGFTMSPTFTKVPDAQNNHKNYTGGRDGNRLQKQVRYYVSRKATTMGYKNCEIKNINAEILEELVTTQVMHYVAQSAPDIFHTCRAMTDEAEYNYWLRSMIDGVVVGPEKLVITLDSNSFETMRSDPSFLTWQDNVDTKNEANAISAMAQRICHEPTIRIESDKVVMTLNIMIKRVNRSRMLLTQEGNDLVLPEQAKADASMVQAIGRGFRWRQMLEQRPGISIRQLATDCGFGDSFVNKQLSLLRLAPDILHRALSGTLPATIKLNRLYEAAASLSWDQQRRILGLN